MKRGPGSDPERLGREAEGEREFEPLPVTWDDRARELAASFVDHTAPSRLEQQDLERFCHLCLRFAHVERRIQGDVLCEIPTHLSLLGEVRHPDLLDEVEALAEAERGRLGLPDGPIEDLPELLDDRGIKTIEWFHPSGRREDEASGAFLFDPETGPSLLSLAPPGSVTGLQVLAHEYCHLLADIDPYENRFCTFSCAAGGDALLPGGRFAWEMETEIDLPEVRADLFARAFLLPRRHFAQTLGDFGEGGSRGFHAPRLADVAFYYGVSLPMVLGRLVDLEILPRERARSMAEAHAPQTIESQPSVTADPVTGLPRRFITLCLALFVKEQVSREQLGVLLDADPETVSRLLAWMKAPPKEEVSLEPPFKAPPDGKRSG